MKIIPPSDLVCMGDFEASYPLRVDLVYADAAHKDNVFGTALYRKDAKMWAHRDLARVILRAAQICHAEAGFLFELKDCLRTVEAQARMLDTPLVRANPHWLEEPRLLSSPGRGGHPRGMAVDIVLVDSNGEVADMGTPFDYFTPDKSKNPAARDYTFLSSAALKNRRALEDAMMRAATEENLPLLPLPDEWWDFRFPAAYANAYEPLSDRDLPPEMRMVG